MTLAKAKKYRFLNEKERDCPEGIPKRSVDAPPAPESKIQSRSGKWLRWINSSLRS